MEEGKRERKWEIPRLIMNENWNYQDKVNERESEREKVWRFRSEPIEFRLKAVHSVWADDLLKGGVVGTRKGGRQSYVQFFF